MVNDVPREREEELWGTCSENPNEGSRFEKASFERKFVKLGFELVKELILVWLVDKERS